MQLLVKLFLLAMIFCCSADATAQPTITFTPSAGTTLTYDDVSKVLAANELTRDSTFHAIIENATVVGGSAFAGSGLLTVDLGDVITIRSFAFNNTPLKVISSSVVDTI